MITHRDLWRRTEARLLAGEPRSYKRAQKVFEALYREARALGVFRRRDPLEGLAHLFHLAAALNRMKR